MWPHPRRDRIRACIGDPTRYEEADAFTYLAENGFGFTALDPSPYPLNPLARRGSALAGIDAVRFLRLLRNYPRFDCVVSMDSSSGLLFSLLKRLPGRRKPLIVIDPALTDTYRLRQRIHDLALPAADAVVVFGTVQERYLRDRYGPRVNVRFIRHRIDARFFDPARVAGPAPSEPYVLAVGDDVGRDFRTLLAAVTGTGVKVLIKSGRPMPGPLPANVQVLASRISFEELRALYQHAQFVALPLYPTLHASGINTLLEGMAMAKVVVVSDSQGIADYVEHGRTAWLVPPENPAMLRGAILGLWEDSRLRGSLGANARQFCLAECSMPVYMRRIAALIAECLG